MRVKGLHIEKITYTLEGYLVKCRDAGGCAREFLVRGRQAFVRNKGAWEVLSPPQAGKVIYEFVNFHTRIVL